MLSEIVTLFVDYVPNQLDVLNTAIECNDSNTVKMQAHSLKGAAGNVGAKCLQDASLKLEKSR